MCTIFGTSSNITKTSGQCRTDLFSFELLYGVIHVGNFTINTMDVLNQFIPRVPNLVFKSIINRQCRRNCFHLRLVCWRWHQLSLCIDRHNKQTSKPEWNLWLRKIFPNLTTNKKYFKIINSAYTVITFMHLFTVKILHNPSLWL